MHVYLDVLTTLLINLLGALRSSSFTKTLRNSWSAPPAGPEVDEWAVAAIIQNYSESDRFRRAEDVPLPPLQKAQGRKGRGMRSS